jgi:hypothetical protein
MPNCNWTSPESYPGKGDGGYSCPKPAMSPCQSCGGEFCNRHIYFCELCNVWMCGSCAGEHVCTKKGPQPETILERVERVCG